LLTVVAENEGSEDCVEFLGEIPYVVASLCHELSLLERRLENQRVHIQTVKSELNNNEEVVLGDKYESQVVKDVSILRKHSEIFVLNDWDNSDENLCADTGKCEVNLK